MKIHEINDLIKNYQRFKAFLNAIKSQTVVALDSSYNDFTERYLIHLDKGLQDVIVNYLTERTAELENMLNEKGIEVD